MGRTDVHLTGAGTSNIISIGQPVSASTGTAANATSDDYGAFWSGSGSQSVSIDLSGVAAANRQTVMVSQFCETDSGYETAGVYDGECAAYSGRPYLAAYTVQINAAAGGSVPASGWSTVATVSGSARLSQAHEVSLAGYNWVRLAPTSAPNGFAIKVEVTDLSTGAQDGWLFCGDSITNTYAPHRAGGFGDQIHTATGRRVAHLNYGMDCVKAADATAWLDELLGRWSGKYVTLGFGANDGYEGAGDASTYYADMLDLVDIVLGRDMTPVVPTITWPNSGGAWETQIEAFNATLPALFAARPAAVEGPDLYALTDGHTSWFQGSGNVHPNETGAAQIEAAWADLAVDLMGA